MRRLITLALGLVLLGTLVQPALAHDIKELSAIACGATADTEKDFRAAASQVLSDKLAGAALSPTDLPTATLNALITDKNSECREAAIDALAQRVLTEGAPFNAAKIQATVDSAKAAASFELGLVRARVGVELVRAGFAERGAGSTSPGADGAINRAEAIARGGTLTLRGVKFDGSVPAIRAAVARYYLTGFYRFFSNIVFGDAKATCDALRARAASDDSPDIRTAAATAFVSGLVIDRKPVACLTGDALVAATVAERNPAVQAAAVSEAAKVLTAASSTDGALLNLALDTSGRSAQGALLFCVDKKDESSCTKTTTSSLRRAAAQALGLRWAKRAEKENLLAPQGVTLLPGILPYNLRVYAQVFSLDSPEAASAVVAPLVVLYSKD